MEKLNRMVEIISIGLVVVGVILWLAGSAWAGMRCQGGFVHQGSSKAEVIQKCGLPIYIDGTIISSSQVWTYNDQGIYRYLHFRGNFLDQIQDGSLVR